MRKGLLVAWAGAIGLVLQLGGCAGLSGRQASQPVADSAQAPALDGQASRDADPWDDASGPRPPPSGKVVPALATSEDAAGPSAVQWTAGVLSDSAASVQRGVNKVTEALIPAPPVVSEPDPTALAKKAKPTPELYNAMARFHEQSGRPETADQAYRQALQLWPKHVGTALNYARFKDRQGLAQDALQVYQNAARQHPNEAAVFNDLGLFLARAGSNAEALRALERAIELQPRRPLYRNNVAALLVDVDQADKAMSHLRSVYREADACYKLGYLLQKKGRSRDAASMFARALQVNPSMTEARVWLQHLEGSRTPPPQVARRPSPNENAPPDAAGQARGSIIREVSPDVPAGPRAGPRSVASPQRPPEVRPLPPPVTPLPRVDEERAKSAGGRQSEARPSGTRPIAEPPLPEGVEPTTVTKGAPLPADSPDAPLPSDDAPRPLPATDGKAPRDVRPLPAVD